VGRVEVVEQRLVLGDAVGARRWVEQPQHVARGAQPLEPRGQGGLDGMVQHVDHRRRIEGAALQVAIFFRDRHERAAPLLAIDVDARPLQRGAERRDVVLAADVEAALAPGEPGADVFNRRLELFLGRAVERADVVAGRNPCFSLSTGRSITPSKQGGSAAHWSAPGSASLYMPNAASASAPSTSSAIRTARSHGGR
jgi:hypothetical protein